MVMAMVEEELIAVYSPQKGNSWSVREVALILSVKSSTSTSAGHTNGVAAVAADGRSFKGQSNLPLFVLV
jgi:hypothetical protein